MAKKSTIQLDKEVIQLLKKLKDTLDKLTMSYKKMAKIFIRMKKRNQYDEFLHKIQQAKSERIILEFWIFVFWTNRNSYCKRR